MFDIATGARKALTKQPSEKGDIVWASNSQKLAYTGANKIWEVDIASGAPRELANNQAGGFTVLQYSADGNWMVYSRRDDDQNAEIYLYDIKAKKEYDVTQSPANETNAALTPDGKTVVFTSNRDGASNPLRRIADQARRRPQRSPGA